MVFSGDLGSLSALPSEVVWWREIARGGCIQRSVAGSARATISHLSLDYRPKASTGTVANSAVEDTPAPVVGTLFSILANSVLGRFDWMC